MEKIGWKIQLFSTVNASASAQQEIFQTQEYTSYVQSLSAELNVLKNINKDRELDKLLDAEEIFLENEKTVKMTSPEEKTSILSALTQLTEARTSLREVKKPEIYVGATATYGAKDKEKGLPVDAFHKFVKGHVARLNNRLKANLSVPEKNVLRQRKENMQLTLELYKGLQRKALGIEAPEKSKGLGL